MRIIRFVADDGRVLCGEERGDGTVAVVRDVCGVLGGQSPLAPMEQLQGRRAVVADDDANMRHMLCAVLEKAGCRCRPCADGSEAIAAIGCGDVDLVVSDIRMPGPDGYEIFAAARRLRPDMPVLLVTGFGYDPTHALVKAGREGLKGVLYKPFTPQQLLSALCQTVSAGDGNAAHMLQRTSEIAGLSALLAPISPANIICIGRNYPGGPGAEPGRAVEDLEVFMKPTTALQASGESIRMPRFDDHDVQLDCEGELALVIGSPTKDVGEADALGHVLGYTIATDVTARRWQTASGPPKWMRGKGFDTFCPLGPALVTGDAIVDPDHLTITTTVNGRVIRCGSTADMIHGLRQIVCELSRRFTLEPGTLILTGGPPRLAGADGAASIKPGDEVAVEVPEIGRLVNRVVPA